MSKTRETSMPAVTPPLARLRLVLVAWAIPFLLTPAHGAGISISGTVKDADGKAVGGASVYAVADPKVKTTSAADGAFTLTGSIPDPPAPADGPDKGKVPELKRTPVAAAKDGCMTAQVLSPALTAKDVQFRLYPAILGATVTLMGNRLSHNHVREEADWDNATGKGKKEFLFLLAFDGPPGVKAEADQIWNDYYPGDGLDGDAARELENQFKTRMRYYIDGPLAPDPVKAENYGGGHPMSLTGTIHEKDGKQYITVTAEGKYNGPTYPGRVTQPDKPLVKLPVKPGLAIKLTDTLTDTLVYVPAGKFYMGNALEQYPHWQEAPQHMVTFRKGFYMADHPITNAEDAAVTGDASANPKKYPDDAAVNISCEMFLKYVKALEKLNPGLVIRAPTKSEWEYAARSGTSNLYFNDNKNAKTGEAIDLTTPVKSKKPNAWGFYGIGILSGSERSSDDGFFGDHKLLPDATDPRYPCRKCLANPGGYHVHANGSAAHYPVNELLNDEGYVGTDAGGKQRNGFKLITQRIVVEEKE